MAISGVSLKALRSPLCRLSEAIVLLGRLARLPSVQGLLAERSLTQRLTCCWVLALALVGLGAIGATALTMLLTVEQRDHARLINDAGSQRARTQRIAAFLTDLAQDDPIEAELARQELARIVARAETVFAAMVDGPRPPAQHTAALRAHYFEGPLALAPRLARFLTDLRAVLRDAEEGLAPHPEAVAALRREALGPLLVLLDEAVTLHTDHAQSDVQRLVWGSLVVGAASLLLVVAIGLGIFRPMTRAIGGLIGQLSGLAFSDPLTGLANRRSMVEALGRAIAARRSLAAVAIDLDHFKEANERAGHAGGDALLRAAAERIRAAVRQGDIVGRIGGDEFLVFLVDLRDESALGSIVERLRTALHQPVPWEGRMLRLGATIGMALCPDDADEPEILLRLADEALMRAKRERRGSIARATRADSAIAEVTRELLAQREDGAALDPPAGLRVVFQPVLPLTGSDAPRPIGFEALTRWEHPRFGPLPLSLLFGSGADRATALHLGRLVRRLALASFAGLRSQLLRPARLALNLSLAEVVDDQLLQTLRADLHDFAVDAADLCLEITEEVLLDRVSDRSLEQLRALRAEGACLALDDFGTGTSGLTQLLRLPIDILKIDRVFVQTLSADRKAQEIVRATLGLARALDLLVVAEGVEQADQVALLRELGCPAAQGFYFARPMDAAALRAWLAAGGRAEPAAQPGGARPRACPPADALALGAALGA